MLAVQPETSADALEMTEQPSSAAAEETAVPFTENPEAMETAAKSVVRLEVYDYRGDKIASGSGFIAFEPAVLVTASHVIVNMEYMLAETDDGQVFQIDETVYINTDSDVAYCTLPENLELAALPVAGEAPLRGESAAVISSQFGITNLVTLGNICGRWDSGNTEWILFTAPVSGGSSGGPLLNNRGEVVGVVTGSYERGQNLNLAAPLAER